MHTFYLILHMYYFTVDRDAALHQQNGPEEQNRFLLNSVSSRLFRVSGIKCQFLIDALSNKLWVVVLCQTGGWYHQKGLMSKSVNPVQDFSDYYSLKPQQCWETLERWSDMTPDMGLIQWNSILMNLLPGGSRFDGTVSSPVLTQTLGSHWKLLPHGETP